MRRFHFGSHLRWAIAGWLLTLIAAPAGAAEPGEKPIDYNRDIKPIFSNRCYACHGPDQGKREAELRLDLRAEAIKKAIVPGKSAASPLLKRITSQDPDEHMPPPDSKKPRLTPAEIALIQRWIDQGAAFDLHWSYVKPARPPLPAIKNKAWAKNPIDHFIAERHEAQGYQPAPEADKQTLIRRLSFDLTGLPPTPEEVNAFVADPSPGAYEALVDRLLASEHYGERMAIYWLDLVRYADTGGYHSDNHRDIALYRDYVIQAFNGNKRFDQFTIEQLAGDLAPNATTEQKIASGYNRLLMTTEEGGAQAKEYTAKYAADRVRNASTVWLAATLGCSECHDHKFDPYRSKDFYSFASFFADIKEAAVGRQEQTPLPTPAQLAALAEFDRQIADAKQALAKTTPELQAAQAQWEQTALTNKPVWTVLTPASVTSKNGATLKVLADGSILASDKNPDKDTYTVVIKTPLKGLTALRLEVLPDDSLPAKGPGRSANGNFVLHEVELTVGDKLSKLVNASGTHSQQKFPAAAVADGKLDTGWAILPEVGKPNHVVFETSADFGDGPDTALSISLQQDFGTSHTIGHFRLSATTTPRPVRAEGADGLPKNIADILALEAGKRTPEQKQALTDFYRGIAPALAPQRAKVAELEKKKEETRKNGPTTLISTAIPPRTMKILPRGNWLDDSGEIVTPGVPEFLLALNVKDRRPTRLDLAQWLVAADNPLVARVFVNRLWKLALGQGIVKSLDDFGSQGAQPTHPQLLDWLAVDFVESGWDVKRLLKQIAMSSTYRQSSKADGKLRDRDPGNLWLARQGRFRLDAEMVRDNALAISGLLSPKIGGPSVKPYQPEGYWAYLNFPVREYQHDHGDNQYRRGLYTYWQRSFLHPSLLAFDAASREECTVERPRSNTPLQALVLLNDPTYVEAARVFAAKAIREGGTAWPERLDYVFRRALGRKPTAEEAKTLLELHAKHHKEYTSDPKTALALVSVGEAKPSEGLDPAEFAAWISVTRVVMNLHETITRN